MKLTVVGVTGPAGCGKDTVASALINERKYQKVAFADPLYRIMKLESAKQLGDKAAPFELFRLVVDLMGGPGLAPPLETVVQIVQSDLTKIANDTGLMQDLMNKTKPRHFLQYVGTEYFRAFDNDIWANYFVRQSLAMVETARQDYFDAVETGEHAVGEGLVAVVVPEPHLKIVVTDVRFNNEPKAIEELVARANDLGRDVTAHSHIIKLDLPREVAAKRVSDRDGIPVEDVMARMGHASEAGVDDQWIDHVINADQPVEDVVRDVFAAIDGTLVVPRPAVEFIPAKKPAVVASGIVDLSQFARSKGKEEQHGGV